MSSTTANYPSTYADTERRVRRSTETKAGPKTTEFFMSLAFVVAVLIAAYMDSDDSFAREDGWFFAAIVAAAYAVSRGLAKLGVREPYTDTVDAR
jgi:hypothetical protein